MTKLKGETMQDKEEAERRAEALAALVWIRLCVCGGGEGGGQCRPRRPPHVWRPDWW